MSRDPTKNGPPKNGSDKNGPTKNGPSARGSKAGPKNGGVVRGDASGGPKSGQDVALIALNDFAGWVESRGASTGSQPIGQSLAHYMAERGETAGALMDKAVDDLLAERQRKIWERARQQPFERVMVERISHLFPAEGQLGLDGKVISRRILPGLMHAMEMMIGYDDLRHHRHVCRDIVESAKAADPEGFDWRSIYDSKDANDLVDDVLASGVHHIDSSDAGLDWFRRLVNANLPPPDTYSFEGPKSAAWTLELDGARAVLKALFSRLRERSGDPAERQALEQRHGSDIVERVVQFHDTL